MVAELAATAAAQSSASEESKRETGRVKRWRWRGRGFPLDELA
jgi:hypothetical protein